MRILPRNLALPLVWLLFLSPFAVLAQTAKAADSGLPLQRGWVQLGPDGGDVRSLSFDPRNPDRIFLGTSAGQMYVSTDNGASWSRFARLGGGDYVLDNMEIDPQSETMYVAAWDGAIERENGDLFRSSDGGRTWQVLPDVHGKSIRAMALAHSDPKIIVVGALDGVYRSRDGGDHFERISPPNHAEIKNIESVAIDPKDPNIIYAGTWHLAWKTSNGGRSWHSIKQGVIDDSDVFSIIVDSSNTQNVYLSACSGIYKSENQAELFHKIQGIPFSARRTRVLKQDPENPAVVYAGTTEGLWKTVDAGKAWRRVSAASLIVNDVHIDPRNSSRVLVATDRSGVLASNDGGQTLVASNRGFAHRYISSVVIDRNDPQTLYTSVVNDKEYGGVFVSRSGGREWRQLSSGFEGKDVFVLRQAANGTLVAGTNRGAFALERNGTRWMPINTVMREKVLPALPQKPTRFKKVSASKKTIPAPRMEWVKSELTVQVNSLELLPKKWLLASSAGLYQSLDEGKSWNLIRPQSFVDLEAAGDLVLAVTHTGVLISRDSGKTWSSAQLPAYVTAVYGAAIEPSSAVNPGQDALWLATREGALRSKDGGATWEHLLAGLPARHLARIQYNPNDGQLLAVALNGNLFFSRDGGESWHPEDTGFPVRMLAFAPGRVVAASRFDGIIAPPEPLGIKHASLGGGNE